MERPGLWVRAVLTALLFVLVFWWLTYVGHDLGAAPLKDAKGNVVVDEYSRAKDILLVLLPLLTTALGYWFGAAGKDKAEANASKAQKDADSAQKRLQGVLDSSSEPGLLNKAREKYPEAFAHPDADPTLGAGK